MYYNDAESQATLKYLNDKSYNDWNKEKQRLQAIADERAKPQIMNVPTMTDWQIAAVQNLLGTPEIKVEKFDSDQYWGDIVREAYKENFLNPQIQRAADTKSAIDRSMIPGFGSGQALAGARAQLEGMRQKSQQGALADWNWQQGKASAAQTADQNYWQNVANARNLWQQGQNIGINANTFQPMAYYLPPLGQGTGGGGVNTRVGNYDFPQQFGGGGGNIDYNPPPLWPSSDGSGQGLSYASMYGTPKTSSGGSGGGTIQWNGNTLSNLQAQLRNQALGNEWFGGGEDYISG